MSQNIINVSDDSFNQEVLQANIPVLADFWAEWCGPCKMLTPTLEEVAGEYIGKLKVVKVNVDHSGITATQFTIRSIPSLLFFKNGQVVATHTGLLTKSQLKAFIDDNLK